MAVLNNSIEKRRERKDLTIFAYRAGDLEFPFFVEISFSGDECIFFLVMVIL